LSFNTLHALCQYYIVIRSTKHNYKNAKKPAKISRL